MIAFLRFQNLSCKIQIKHTIQTKVPFVFHVIPMSFSKGFFYCVLLHFDMIMRSIRLDGVMYFILLRFIFSLFASFTSIWRNKFHFARSAHLFQDIKIISKRKALFDVDDLKKNSTLLQGTVTFQPINVEIHKKVIRRKSLKK